MDGGGKGVAMKIAFESLPAHGGNGVSSRIVASVKGDGGIII